MQIRLFQTLNEVANQQNSTIILPVPIDLFQPFMEGMNGSSDGYAASRPSRRVREVPGGGPSASRRNPAEGANAAEHLAAGAVRLRPKKTVTATNHPRDDQTETPESNPDE